MQNKSLQMIKAILKSAFGLFLYSCGVYLTVQANIGSAPWECLSMAISGKVGLFVMGFGQYFYMSAGQSCGPRDSLTIALGKRFPNHPVGLVQSVIVGVVLLIGWVLDGPIGIGTVISVFVAGTALQIVCRIMHFEPRNVKHLNLLEATKLLLSH